MWELLKPFLISPFTLSKAFCANISFACQPKMFILLPGILRALVLRKYFKGHVLECALHRPIVGNGLNGLRVEQLKPWSLVYCFTLRAFQLCIKLSRDIKTLCSCRLTLCTSGLSMISISRTLSPGMGMQGVKSYSFLYTKKRDKNKTQQKGAARWGGIAFRGVVRCFLFSTLLQVYK